jgi:hypothetical protein
MMYTEYVGELEVDMVRLRRERVTRSLDKLETTRTAWR